MQPEEYLGKAGYDRPQHVYDVEGDAVEDAHHKLRPPRLLDVVCVEADRVRDELLAVGRGNGPAAVVAE